ncbi:hypothetical protein ACOMHN_014964 [Nucella lapillus]
MNCEKLMEEARCYPKGSIHENFPCVAKSLDILVGREHEYLSVADTVIMQEEASTIIGVCVWGNDNDIRKSFRQNGPIFPELPVQCCLNLVEAREVIGYIIGVLGSIHFKDCHKLFSRADPDLHPTYASLQQQGTKRHSLLHPVHGHVHRVF